MRKNLSYFLGNIRFFYSKLSKALENCQVSNLFLNSLLRDYHFFAPKKRDDIGMEIVWTGSRGLLFPAAIERKCRLHWMHFFADVSSRPRELPFLICGRKTSVSSKDLSTHRLGFSNPQSITQWSTFPLFCKLYLHGINLIFASFFPSCIDKTTMNS